MDSAERKSFAILALALIATAWTSYGYFELDEHFQIIEFAGSKLGIVPTQNLPWEYEAGIRPWLMPVLFAGLCKFLAFCGIENRFIWTFIFRLCCAGCGFFAVLGVYRLSLAWFPDARVRHFNLRLCTLLGFLPYLFVRTSSESLSASFVTIGMVVLLKNYRESKSVDLQVPDRIWLLSGLMMGLAFQCRYQSILMIGGLGLWLLWAAKIKWRNILAASSGFLAILAAGLLADRYGNGKWTFPFYKYFQVNLLEGKTADFGTDPFFAYFYLVLANVFAPVVLVLMAAIVVFWVRKYRHVISWITLPFFLFHCLVGHKEERFLFPIIPLCLLIPALLFVKDGKLDIPDFFHRRFWRQAYKWLWRYNYVWLIVLCVYPLCVEPYIKHQKFIYERRNTVNSYYAVEFNPYQRKELTYSFYRPAGLSIVEIENIEELAAIAKENSGREIYFFWKMPYLENWPESLSQRTSLVNSSYFFFNWPWFVKTCTPILKNLHERFEEVQCPSLFKISAFP